MNYGPTHDPRTLQDEPARGAISVYAQGRDYHDVMKTRLKALGRFIWDNYRHSIKVFVDTAPLMEKPSGQAAGHGWRAQSLYRALADQIDKYAESQANEPGKTKAATHAMFRRELGEIKLASLNAVVLRDFIDVIRGGFEKGFGEALARARTLFSVVYQPAEDDRAPASLLRLKRRNVPEPQS